jgi:hypothetical protein
VCGEMVKRSGEHLCVGGASTMIWRCLRGDEEKCSDTSSVGFDLTVTQPGIRCGL